MISDRDRRKEPRTCRLFGVAFLLEGVSVKATVTDISRSGAFLHSRVLPRVGTRLDLAIKVQRPQASVVMITGEVVRVVEESSGPGRLRGFAVRWLAMRSREGPAAVAEMLREMGTGPIPESLPMTPTPTSVEYSFEQGRFVNRTPTDPRFRARGDTFEPPDSSQKVSEMSLKAWPVSIPATVFHRKETIPAVIRKLGRKYLALRTETSLLPVSAMVSIRLVLDVPAPRSEFHLLGLVVATSPDPAGGGEAEVRVSSINGEERSESFESVVEAARTGKLPVGP